MAEQKIRQVDLDKDFDASVARLMELKRGRNESDIPITDEYWKSVTKHRNAHNPNNKK